MSLLSLFLPTGGGNVSVGITGNSATSSVGNVSFGGSCSVGTLLLTLTLALTGVAGTGNAGTVAPDRTVALTGVVGTGAAGDAVPSANKAISGEAATCSVQAAVPSGELPLTGNSGTGSPGDLAPSQGIVLALTGNLGTGAVGDVTGEVSSDIALPISGVAGAASVGTLAFNGTCSVGDLTPSAAKVLSGNQAHHGRFDRPFLSHFRC